MASEEKSHDTASLRQMVVDVSHLENYLIECGGELTPEIEAMIQIKEAQLPEKIDNYSLVMDRMTSISDFYESRAAAFLAISRAADRVVDRCKENLKFAMHELNTDELKGNDVRFKLVKSNPACQIDNEDLIDGAYKITETIVKIDKKRIAEDLKLGVPVAGAQLIEGFSLRKYVSSPKKVLK